MDLRKIYIEEHTKPYFEELMRFIKAEYETKVIYPPAKEIYEAFKYVADNPVKVVIIGQDPYHGVGQAHGLSFSVKPGVPLPKSLINIYQEMKDDVEVVRNNNGNLVGLAKQGVFWLNTILTVEAGKPLSHKNKGWEIFTSRVISELNDDNSPKVFILWGREARNLKEKITNPNHLILESVHPSPLSAYSGFFGSKPFSKTNQFLIKNNLSPIDWGK